MTNYMKQKFQWFFDMSTSTTAIQKIDIAAGGPEVQRRLAPFFGAFKHYKLGAIKVRMVPAATLPVDPTGLSYEAGEQTVDPRDMFNPGLVRITNGEDVPDVATFAEETYYATMLDKRWYKFRLQSGFKRTAKPLVYNVGQVHQDQWPGSSMHIPLLGDDTDSVQYYHDGETLKVEQAYESDPFGLMQTGMIKMGWMPTDFAQLASKDDNGLWQLSFGASMIPKVPLITVILPKAYKTRFYYRVFVEETVMFKDAVSFNGMEASGVQQYYQPLDRYVVPTLETASPGTDHYQSDVTIHNNMDHTR